MDEAVKNRVILILIILNLIFFFWAIGANASSKKQNASLQKEMALRLGLEEEKENFSKSIKQTQEQLDAAQKSLIQEQLANKALKEELEKVNKLKDTLEENLKNALVNQPPVPKK